MAEAAVPSCDSAEVCLTSAAVLDFVQQEEQAKLIRQFAN